MAASSAAHTSAPFSRPVIKKRSKTERAVMQPPALPRMSSKERKRARPSDGFAEDKPASARRLSDRSQDVYKRGMFLSFVESALDEYRTGDATRYSELLQQFRTLAPDAPRDDPSTSAPASSNASQVRALLDALAHVVSKLDDSHDQLINVIVKLPWASLDDDFVFAYARFASALVSSRPQWLRGVLEQCVKGLRYRSHFTMFARNSPGTTRKLIYDRVHGFVRAIYSLVPTMASALAPLLALHFPSKRESRHGQMCYLNNLLTLAEYCPAVAETALSAIIERAVALDVELQGDPDDWDEDEATLVEETKQMSNLDDLANKPITNDSDSDDDDDDDEEDGGLDLDNIDSDDDGEIDPVSDSEAEVQARHKGMSYAEKRRYLATRDKLDGFLKVLFDHFASVHSVTPPGSPSAVKEEMTPTPDLPVSVEDLSRRGTLFRTLLDIFDRVLLRTFKTRNVQFLLFYLCSLDAASTDHFVGVLLGRAIYELDQPLVTRVAAAGYAASFVSRARFIDGETTRKVIAHLCRYMGNVVDEFDMPGTTSHLPVFFAAAQAVMYIFCFRWRDLLDESEDDDVFAETPTRRWVPSLDTLKKALTSPLNPLKVCARPVIDVFAETAHETNFAYIYPLLNSTSNDVKGSKPTSLFQRGRTDSSSTLRPGSPAKNVPVTAQLDSFFPFDPFKLRESSVYIDDIYREWEGNDNGSATNGESSSEDASSETASPFLMPTSGGLRVPGMSMRSPGDDAEEEDVAKSLEAMSLSPERNWLPSSV